MGTTELEQLMARRPKAYGWLNFQRFLIWLFLILGILLFIHTITIVAMGFMKIMIIEEASREVALKYQADEADVHTILVKYLEPFKYAAILYSFFLSMSCFVIARYCQKIINRNRYILQIEQALKKLTRP